MEVVDIQEPLSDDEERELTKKLASLLWPSMKKDLLGTATVLLWIASNVLKYSGINTEDSVALIEHFMDGKPLPARIDSPNIEDLS